MADEELRVSLERQLEIFDIHAEDAARRLAEIIGWRAEELVQLARHRAFESIGVHEYGDSTYFLDEEQLEDEMLAELADAIFYAHIAMARRAGDL